MKKWVIAFMLLGFAMTFVGCGSSCPQGICDKEYYEKNGSGAESEGGGE